MELFEAFCEPVSLVPHEVMLLTVGHLWLASVCLCEVLMQRCAHAWKDSWDMTREDRPKGPNISDAVVTSSIHPL